MRLLRGSLAAVFLIAPLLAVAEVREGEESVSLTVTTNGVRELPPEDETRLRVFVHDERPNHRASEPVCQPTQNDGNETYGLVGWHVPTGGLLYGVNTRSAPSAIRSGVADAIGAAASTWANADSDKQLTPSGSSTISRPRYDGQNVMMWRSLSRGTLAVAYVWYNPANGEVLDADMVFSTRVKWSINDPSAGDCGGTPSTYDVRAIATHEFGHWLGLDDLYDGATVDLTMYGFATFRELKKATLGAGDVAGATAVAP